MPGQKRRNPPKARGPRPGKAAGRHIRANRRGPAMTAIEGIGRATANAIGGRARQRPQRAASPSRPNRRRRPRRSRGGQTEEVALASMLTLQELGGETRQPTARRGATGRICWRRWPSCSGRCWAAWTRSRRMQRLADLAAAVPRAADPRLAAMISAISRPGAGGAGAPAGLSRPAKLLHVSLLKLRHPPLAELSAVAISPRKCDP